MLIKRLFDIFNKSQIIRTLNRNISQLKNGKKILKHYQSKEIAVARKIMSQRNGYYWWPHSRSQFEPNNEHSEHFPLLSNFKFVCETAKANNISIASEMFTSILKQIIINSSKFSSADLMQILNVFAIVDVTSDYMESDTITAVRGSLSSACVSHCPNWEMNQLFYVCDIWTMTPLGNRSDFAQIACETIAKRVNELAPVQLVQGLLYLSWHQRVALNMDQFEGQLERYLDQLTLDELGIVLLGFFRTQAPLTSRQLVADIYTRLLNEDLVVLDDVTLTSIIKALRKSSRSIPKDQNIAFLDKLVSIAKTCSSMACLHMALLASKTRYCNNQLMEIICQRTLSDIKAVRIKEMERISYVLTKLDFKSDCMVKKKLLNGIVIELTKRSEEISEFPRVFSNCVRYLACNGLECQHLIKQILNPEFLKSAYGQAENYDEEILFLDSFTRINLARKYFGPQLSDEERFIAASRFSVQMPNVEEEKELFEILQKVYRHPRLVHILPHFSKADILLVYDRTRSYAVDRCKSLLNDHTGNILARDLFIEDNRNLEVLIFIMASTCHTIFKNSTSDLTGEIKFKIKQLNALGYLPIVINHLDWRSTLPDQRKQFIVSKINEVLDTVV